MKKIAVVFSSLVILIGSVFIVILAGSVTAKEYLKDWQSMDAPKDAAKVITIPQYPEAGRIFEIRRTFLTKRSDRRNRRTPPGGYKETLKVADDKGTLEFWREGRRIHRIELGPCFSFAKMDRNHAFGRRGSPAYFTAPPDCKVWDGRLWNQTYRTLVVGWSNPCVYEAKRSATVFEIEDARRFRTSSTIHMTMDKNGKTYDWSNVVEYDENTRFFSMFNVGYVGRVEILREILPGTEAYVRHMRPVTEIRVDR